ncbi:MAG: FAD-dependent oxidoreductase, partial [Lachnospiraceae bacterium]|nr:FAD-dependent oxidoreductase [Lachnospiraceae bacterium]
PPISLLFAAISGGGLMKKYGHISRDEYAGRFTHEGIREMIRALPGGEQGIPIFFLTMGALARGDGRFPEGGSLPFIGRIVKELTAHGGEIKLKTKAERIIMEKGKAVGIIANGEKIPADAVIIASDTMNIDEFFDVPLNSPWFGRMKKEIEPTTVTFVSLGINADLKHYPERPLVKLKSPLRINNNIYNSILLSNYASDPHYSPNGKSVITLQLPGDTFDFWQKAKEENRYNEEKQKIADAVIAILEEIMPETLEKVEVCDVATPLTYYRYCGSWRGSWMSAIKADLNTQPYPSMIDGLNGVYLAGQRLMPPGGIPPAAMSGRTAVQHLCRDTGTLFVSE